MRRLALIYDPEALSWSTCRWIDGERKHVPLETVSAKNPRVAALLPGVDPASLAGRIVLVDDVGNVWLDKAAELVALWALRRYRARALAIGHPSRLPFRRGTLNRIAGGTGDPWPERSDDEAISRIR